MNMHIYKYGFNANPKSNFQLDHPSVVRLPLFIILAFTQSFPIFSIFLLKPSKLHNY